MSPVESTFFDEVKKTVRYTPALLGAGALLGYVISVVSHLPAKHCAKAWAIWIIAEYTLLSLGCALAKKETHKHVIRAVLFTFTTAIGIDEMRSRGLMGDRLTAIILLMRCWIIFASLTKAIVISRRNMEKI